VRYLTIEEIFAIHDRAIREYGGSPELMNLGHLESTLAAPRQTMFGEELYPDVLSKAAILFYLLIKNHPFLDGNKRMAFLTLMRFLDINGYSLSATNDKLYQFTIDVASSVLTKEEVETWIRDKAIPSTSLRTGKLGP
jgi:death-on-curing protein